MPIIRLSIAIISVKYSSPLKFIGVSVLSHALSLGPRKRQWLTPPLDWNGSIIRLNVQLVLAQSMLRRGVDMIRDSPIGYQASVEREPNWLISYQNNQKRNMHMFTTSVVCSLFIGNSRLHEKVKDFRLMKYTKTHFNLSNNPVYKKKIFLRLKDLGLLQKIFNWIQGNSIISI